MIKKLSDICSFVSGNAWKASEFADEGIPIIRINNMNTNDNDFVYWQGDYDKRYLINKGDLLVSLSGTIKTFQWNGPEALLNQRIVKVVANADTNQDWVYYQVSHVIEQIANKGKHAVIKNVSVNDLKSFEVDVPDFQTQNKTVAILDKARALVEKRQTAIELLDDLLRAQFLEMFGQVPHFEPTNNTEPLGNFISIKHGFAFKSQYFTDSGKFVLLTPGNFKEEGGYRDRGEKQKYYNGPVPDGYLLNKNDLLVAMTEQAPGLLGSPVLIPESNVFLHNQRLGLVEIKSEKLNKHFLYYLFNSGLMRNIIHVRSTGVKVRHTSPTKIEAIDVAIPSIIQQEEFSRIAEKIETAITKSSTALKQTNELFFALLQRAFTGKLNLNVLVELDSLLEEIDLHKAENDLYSILSNEEYVNSLVERLNTQRFESQDLYDKAKHAAFQLLKAEEIITQVYDESSKSLKLAVK